MGLVKAHLDCSTRFRWNMKIALSGSILFGTQNFVFWFKISKILFSVPMDRGTLMEQPGTLEVVQRWIVPELHHKFLNFEDKRTIPG